MAAVAEHKGIALTALSVSVQSRTEFEGRSAATCFSSRLSLGGRLTPREQRILFSSARTCEVHKMLHGEVVFEEYLVDGSQAPLPGQGGE